MACSKSLWLSYEIHSFFSLHLLINSAVGGIQNLHWSKGGEPRAPILLPLGYTFPYTKEAASSWGCGVQPPLAGNGTIGRSLVRHTAEPTGKDGPKV